jgi:hypothetical protein
LLYFVPGVYRDKKVVGGVFVRFRALRKWGINITYIT